MNHLARFLKVISKINLVDNILRLNLKYDYRFRALGIDRAVENAELQDKLEKSQNELRRAQVLLFHL